MVPRREEIQDSSCPLTCCRGGVADTRLTGMFIRQTKRAGARQCLPHNIPIIRPKGGRNGGFLEKDSKRRHENLAAEIEKLFVGPMPADEFVSAFLPADPKSDEGMPTTKDAFGSVCSNDGICEKRGIANLLVSRLVI